MKNYAIHKIIQFFLIIPAVAVGAFILLNFSPVDPVEAYIGADVMRIGPEQRLKIEKQWGMDQTPTVRMFRWVGAVCRGDLGTSLIFNKPVATIIKERFIASLSLMAAAWIFSGIIGYALGVYAAFHRFSFIDKTIRSWSYILAASPPFWLGIMLLIVFSVYLQITPMCCEAPPGLDKSEITLFMRLHHLLLPALTLSLAGVAAAALHTREKVIDIMDSEYVTFARSQGEAGFGLFFHHIFPNSLLPALTLQFASFSELYGGSVLAETVFSYPGLGRAAVMAGLRSDVPLLLGIVIFSTLFVFAGNTLADLCSRIIDPRIRLGEKI